MEATNTAKAMSFTAHAEYRMRQMRVEADEVLRAISTAEVTYQQNRPGRPRTVVMGGRFRIPIDPCTRTVVTVIWRYIFSNRCQPPPGLENPEGATTSEEYGESQ